MAEILAVSGALAVIVQLAEYGMKFSKIMIQFSHQVGSAYDEIENFALQVQMFSQVIGLARVTLLDHCSEVRESKVIRDIGKNQVLDGLAEQSRNVEKRLRVARRRVLAMKSKCRPLTVLKWILGKEYILKLSPDMESVKSTVDLLLSMVLLEKIRLSKEEMPQVSRAEIDRLQRDM